MTNDIGLAARADALRDSILSLTKIGLLQVRVRHVN